MGGASHRTSPSRANPPRGGHARALTSTHYDGEYTRDSRRHLFWSLEARPKENGETGFPISPLRTHLRQAFVALAAGRGWPQPPKGPRVTNGLRDPRSPPPSSGHDRSMRMDRSHRTPAPVSRQQPPLERRCGAPPKTTSRNTPEAHQQLSPPRGNLTVPLLRSMLSLARHTKLRCKNHLPRGCHEQARESSAAGGLAG